MLTSANNLRPVYTGAVAAPCHRRKSALVNHSLSFESCWKSSDIVVGVVVVVLFCFSESPLLVIAERMFSKKATFLHVFINCLSCQ